MRLIDLRHLGCERVIGSWLVGDVLIDPGPASSVETLLVSIDEPPAAILLTHIHLDHAASVGALVRRWPDVKVYVHERGAPHVVDPSRLINSATRVYGNDLERLWGRILPIPAKNVHALEGGEQIGDFRTAATPGHASHHLAFLHEPTGWAFAGDVAGVRIAPCAHIVMPTLPPEVDLAAWHASLDLIGGWEPVAIVPTHFGAFGDVDSHLQRARDELEAVSLLAQRLGPEDFRDTVVEQIVQATDPEDRDAYEQASRPDQMYAGLARWAKQSTAG
jgi:glyoxylase-like metal-dependent hydrolase (beta-lactamase superfamily II)